MKQNGAQERILQLLLGATGPLSGSEMARRLGCHRSSVKRAMDQLSLEYPIQQDEDKRFSIDKSFTLQNVKLNMFEMEFLHIASRLFARVMHVPFPHAVDAIRKLANAQRRVSQPLAELMHECADELEQAREASGGGPSGRDPAGSAQPENGQYENGQSVNGQEPAPHTYQNILETLGLAISERRWTRLHYDKTDGSTGEYTVLPVTIEPSHEGRAVYLVAWNPTRAIFSTYKLERIRRCIPGDPDPDAYRALPLRDYKQRLRHAWGIWTTSDDPVRVRLHFSQDIAGRIRETRWHASQHLEPQPDGSLILQLHIASPTDMYPWIRSFGHKVRVLEPQQLREDHIADLRKALEAYGD